MKKLIALLTVALFGVVAAQAQQSAGIGYQAVALPLTYAAGTTNYPATNSPVIGAIKQQNLALQSTLSAAAAGCTNQYFFAPSVDGISYDTNITDAVIFSNSVPFNIAPGTSTKTVSINVAGYNYLKLYQVITLGTATNGYLTSPTTANGGLSYGIKIQAP